ncbi:MAG TPA: DNA polymerase III subunit delta [Candidatus Limnocylindrales bacterium]|nr:DNA polymerase III subunit delta [Candidatus Limnocylindrales bacterium]
MSGSAPIAYLYGDDDFGLDRATADVAATLEVGAGSLGPLERWRVRGDAIDQAALAERVATAPLFGGGTLAIVVDSGPLIRSAAGRAATIAALDAVAPGNGLVFLDAGETGARRTVAADALRDAVRERGGQVREVRAPAEGRMAAAIEAEARRQGVRLESGAAQELATRVGAGVREGDVDRRQMSARAAAELAKLALYRPDGPVTRDDVRALVGETIPPSTWAFLDAVGSRRGRRAAELLDQLLATTPEPVLVAQLHRRIRDLVSIADLLASGTPESGLVRALKLNPYRAKILAGQARTWRQDELDGALQGLVDLDAIVKGAEPASPRQVALAFQLWLRDHVAVGK